MVTLDTQQKPERLHCGRRMCAICRRVKRDKALKVKLMLRRPYNQLVDQGIMPPLKTPPAFHEQAKQLERRKTGDLLKAKIQQRPGRDELVRQHILEDVGHVDPSLAERQRMLKKARLADQLNDQLSHRPGPLELIQKNILHTEEPIERAVKEGQIPFKATCEGQLTKPQHPDHYITFEDDSQSSEGGSAPSPPLEASRSSSTSSTASVVATVPTAVATTTTTAIASTTSVSGGGGSDVLETAATNAGIVTVSLSIPTEEGAVLVTSPVFQNSSQQMAGAVAAAAQAQPAEAATIQTFADLCNSVVGGQELQQHVTAAQVADSPLLISIASPGSSMSSTTTLLPLAPAPSPMSLGSTTSSLSPLSNISIASPPAAITPRPQPSPIAAATAGQRSDAPGKDKNRKKSKTKSQPKTRTIKFHEYKGPPNAQKACSSSSTSGLTTPQQNQTSYELLLHQQQLFLQYEVELKNKGKRPIHPQRMYPQLILPAGQKPITLAPSNSSIISNDSGNLSGSSNASINAPSPASSNASSNPSEQPPLRPLGKLEDMKVSDLKVELKRRNLPVSGSKPQLIERLKPFTESSSHNASSNSNGQHVTQMGHILMDTPVPMSTDDSRSHKGPNSPKDESMASPRMDSPHRKDQEESSSPPGDTVLKEHYRKKIDELQRELVKIRSQQQLQLFQNHPVSAEKLVLQQHLHNKMQHKQLERHLQQLQQLQQQQQQQNQHIAFQQAQPNNATIIDSATLTAINNKRNQNKGVNGTTTVQVPAAIVLAAKLNGSILGALVAQAQSQQMVANAEDGKPPPPQYDEAAKMLKVKIEPLQKNPVKSQMVDDVLEILINSGELPPSAAQEPVTPTTPNRQMTQNLVLSAAADSPTGQPLVFTAAPSPMEVTQSECGSPAPQSSSAIPPPPPPLPLATFSVQLPSALQQQQQQQQQQQHDTITLLASDAELEAAMLLSPQSVQQGSPDPQPPQEVTSTDSANLDLKELGLDLDTMDFGQLDCDFGVKMETPQEFMDINSIGDIPMDMEDEPDWLDSLMPQSPAGTVTTTSCDTTPTQHHTTTTSCDQHNDLYDPLLGNSQDPFDLFNIEDPEFRMSSDLPLTWDNSQVDFAT